MEDSDWDRGQIDNERRGDQIRNIEDNHYDREEVENE